MSPIDVLEWIATGLSLIGAVFVAMTGLAWRRRGFLIWIGANLLWMGWAFAEAKWGVFTLFAAYEITAAWGWWNHREPQAPDQNKR